MFGDDYDGRYDWIDWSVIEEEERMGDKLMKLFNIIRWTLHRYDPVSIGMEIVSIIISGESLQYDEIDSLVLDEEFQDQLSALLEEAEYPDDWVWSLHTKAEYAQLAIDIAALCEFNIPWP